ncbi:NADPH--hemoprotein reductase [Malassezia cuniculi]|uniref:NADPH--cytochrome P450 reductase n=1 Tax=Malassezia cuniculi TaxID=948313 RepID=A0AAF0EY71_9BASI|nr:NADPH--hemoprotein reductase [Malassezia cuniculi]
MLATIHLVLIAIAVGAISLYALRGVLFGGRKEPVEVEDDDVTVNSFVDSLTSQGKRVVIFYGSQTGTAEGYAIKIAREIKSRFGTSPLVLDPETQEMEKLDQMPEDCAVVFVIATYGEGEPTDNAVNMMEYLKAEDVTFSNSGSELSNLHYVIFGLGNKTYEYYNETARQLDARLTELGAHRIGERGEADDDGSIEEDYLAWKDPALQALAQHLGIEEGVPGEVSDYAIEELAEGDFDENRIYQGEYSQRGLLDMKGSHDQRNPYPAPVAVARELFVEGVADRSCVHVEFDISGSGITYQHGDHLGVWPVNPEPQVTRFLAVLGLLDKRTQPIKITSLDPQLAKVPFPAPTTYEAIFRYYIDINAIASRQALSAFVPFAPSEEARAELERLSKDREYFQERVSVYGYRLAQVLQLVAGDSVVDTHIHESTVWKIPFDRIISAIPRVGPRYYSISSSPKVSPDRIHATVVALRYNTEQGDSTVFGLASNFLSSVKMSLNNEVPTSIQDPRYGTPKYELEGPRHKYESRDESSHIIRVPVHVRRSTFRMPTSTKVPIIMIGPGTGVAPFRGFVQDRVATADNARAKLGEDALKEWADLRLYYGCRRSDEDYLYKDEWPEYAKALEGKLKLRVSLSREVFKADGSKLYVQDLIWEDRTELADAILNKRAYVYICGEAGGMSQDVEHTLVRLLAEARGGSEEVGRAEVKLLRERNRLHLDVW